MNGYFMQALEEYAVDAQNVHAVEVITREVEDTHYELIQTYDSVLGAYLESEDINDVLFFLEVDYISLQFWKVQNGKRGRWDEAMERLEEVMERRGWGWMELMDRIRQCHVVAVGPVVRAVNVRVVGRCRVIKEELMMRTWHPSRVERLLLAGYDVEEM